MTVFQLYKKRDFSALMNDTMDFFKQCWKNYFRNYVIVNGALLLLMCVLYFLFFKDMLKNIYTPGAAGSWLTDSTSPTLIIGGTLSIISFYYLIYPFIIHKKQRHVRFSTLQKA